jgi:hypothetical protein
MHANRGRLLLLAFVMLLVTACGAAGGGSDPSGAVTAALNAANSGGLAKLDDYACAAQKGKIAEAFGGAQGMEQLTAAGVNPADLMNAMQIKFDNVATKETSRTDKEATVHVTGNMTVTADAAKLKPILKALLQAKGLPSDDATIDTALTAAASAMSRTQALNDDIKVVNENGKWLLCE